jgi:hypothetical protein
MTSSAEKGSGNRVASPRPVLGVLLVTGIGVQPRGQTLAECGGAIYRCISEELEALPSGWMGDTTPSSEGKSIAPLAQEFLVGSAMLGQTRMTSPSDLEAPAYAELSIQRLLKSTREQRTDRWLMAESCWSGVIPAPTFKELARFGVTVIPWTIGSHYGLRLRRALSRGKEGNVWLRGLGLLVALASLPISLVFSLVALLLLGAMLLVALLPIPQLRTLLASVQHGMASSFSEAYFLATRPVEAASILTQVRRDLEWIAKRCDRVAVVAHGQGAAIAFESLAQSRPHNLCLFVTVGSGLRKVWELRELVTSRKRFRRALLFGLFAFAYGLLAGGALIYQLARHGLAPGSLGEVAMFAVAATIGLILGIAVGVDLVSRSGLTKLEEPAAALRATGVEWIDFFASADPIPNGSLFSTASVGRSFPESVEVHNVGSIGADNGAYWQNRDGFVSVLVGYLGRAVGMTPLVPRGAHAAAMVRRRWRVGWLVGIRSLLIASCLPLMVRHFTAFQELGGYAARLLWGWLRSKVHASALPASPPPSWATLSAPLGLLLLVVGLYVAAKIAWSAWNEAEMDPQPDTGTLASGIGFVVAASAQLTLLAGLVYGSDRLVGEFLLASMVPMLILWARRPAHRGIVRQAAATSAPARERSAVEATRQYMGLLIRVAASVYFILNLPSFAVEAQGLLRRVLPGHLVPAPWLSFAILASMAAALFAVLGVAVSLRAKRAELKGDG